MTNKRGPPRIPTATLRMRESWRAKDRTDEPTPPDGKPVMPSWLTKEGKRCWQELVPLLDAMGLLAITDRNAIAMYCDCWDQWRKAQKFIAENGQTYDSRVNDEGEVIETKKHPQVMIYKDLTVLLRAMASDFGLTPSARAGMAVKAPKTEDKKAKFFKRA